MLLVPTRVGMILENGLKNKEIHTCPHTRGDDPDMQTELRSWDSLSPHAWG